MFFVNLTARPEVDPWGLMSAGDMQVEGSNSPVVEEVLGESSPDGAFSGLRGLMQGHLLG